MKQYHSFYPKVFIEETLKDTPGGVHIVLEGTTQCEVPLITVGYRYSHKMILFFVLTKNAGCITEGDPYEMKFTNSYGNIVTHYVDCHEIISNFPCSSNTIDTHNELRQDLLQLKKMAHQKCLFLLGHHPPGNQHNRCLSSCKLSQSN